MPKKGAALGNKDLAIRGLPDDVLKIADDMLRGGSSYGDVARYIHTQGYLEDTSFTALKKAIERYKASNAVRLLPDPVLMVANEQDAQDKLQEVLPAKTRTHIEKIFEGIEHDVNEIAILIELVTTQQERVKKAVLAESESTVPLKVTSDEVDRLWKMAEQLMAAKMKLGVLPQVPKQIQMRTESLNINVGVAQLTQVILEALKQGNQGVLGDGETFRETKSRLRQGLINNDSA